MANANAYKLTLDELELGRSLVRNIIESDRSSFDEKFRTSGLELDSALRVDIAAIGLGLAFFALRARRIRHRLPDEVERGTVIGEIASGAFGDAIDPSLAHDVLAAVCGQSVLIPLRGEVSFATTTLVVGATFLDRETRFSWNRRYSALRSSIRRYMVIDEAVRQARYN